MQNISFQKINPVVIGRFLNSVIIVFLLFVSSNLAAGPGDDPNAEPAEKRLMVTDDVVASSEFGSLLTKDTYLQGSLAYRSLTFRTPDSEEVVVTISDGANTVVVRTPVKEIQIKKISATNYEIKDLVTGQTENFYGSPPTSFPEDPEDFLSSTSEPWANQLYNFFFDIESQSSNLQFDSFDPRVKYTDPAKLDSIAVVNLLCPWQESCTMQDWYGIAGGAAFLAWTCSTTGVLGCAASAAFYLTSTGVQFAQDCACIPHEQPPAPPNDPPLDTWGGEDPACSGYTCTNLINPSNLLDPNIVIIGCAEWGHTGSVGWPGGADFCKKVLYGYR